MISELLARSGNAMLKDVPPDGRAYWGARFWDRDSAERHDVLGDEFRRQKQTVRGYLQRSGADAGRVLEVACGTGEFTKITSEVTAAREIVAVDISAQGLEIARGRVNHDNLRLVLGDFWADLGLAPADLVVCIDAIHHLGEVQQVLERLAGFIAPGGTLVGNLWIADHYHDFGRKRYGAAAHLVRTAGFFGTAVMIRASGGRLRTGSYRTQLLSSTELRKILHKTFSEVLDVTVEPYFAAFACKR